MIKMPLLKLKKREYAVQRSPTLNTVLMVEESLKKSDGVITIAELRRKLPKQVMHQTLMAVIDYLDYSGKIVFHNDKVLWAFKPKSKLKMKKGFKSKMRFGKKISVDLIGSALESYNKLNNIVSEQKSKGITNSEEIKLLNGIQRSFDLIENNPFYGRNAKKGLIPGYYIKKYGVDNLFVVNLPLFWRMIYALESDKIEIIAFVLDIFNHSEYNKRFGFRKK